MYCYLVYKKDDSRLSSYERFTTKKEAFKELKKYSRGYIVRDWYCPAEDLSYAWDEAIKANKPFILQDYGHFFRVDRDLIAIKENGKLMKIKKGKK